MPDVCPKHSFVELCNSLVARCKQLKCLSKVLPQPMQDVKTYLECKAEWAKQCSLAGECTCEALAGECTCSEDASFCSSDFDLLTESELDDYAQFFLQSRN